SALGGMLGGPLSARARPSTLTILFAVLLAAVAAVTLLETLVLGCTEDHVRSPAPPSVVITAEHPTLAEVLGLYESVGWSAYTEEPGELERALAGSTRVVIARRASQLVGLARVLSDGATIAYLPAVLVRPDAHRPGLGRRLAGAGLRAVRPGAPARAADGRRARSAVLLRVPRLRRSSRSPGSAALLRPLPAPARVRSGRILTRRGWRSLRWSGAVARGSRRPAPRPGTAPDPRPSPARPGARPGWRPRPRPRSPHSSSRCRSGRD